MMAGWIYSTIDDLRWLVHTMITSAQAYDHIQQSLDDSQVFDKVTERLSRPLLESYMDKLFKKQRRDSYFLDRGLAQQSYASACADWICQQESRENVGNGTVDSYRSELFLIKVISNDCKLKVQETRNGSVETTVSVQVDSLVNPVSEQRISLLLNKLSASGCSPCMTELLQTWSKFSSTMLPKAINTVRLILCGKYGERIKIRCKAVKTKIAVILNDKQQDEIVFEVDEINKRTLGRLIIWLCGNEGTDQTTEKAALRRLIQACISSLEKGKNTCWKNTKLSIYGQDDTSFHILAGTSYDPKHIVGFVDSKGEFQIVERHNSYCIIS